MIKLALLGFICGSIGCVIGFGFMFWVAKEMVNKVRMQEEQRHQELLNMTAEHSAEWQDALNDVIDAVQMGKLQNKSVPDQVGIIRKTIQSSRTEPEPIKLGEDV